MSQVAFNPPTVGQSPLNSVVNPSFTRSVIGQSTPSPNIQDACPSSFPHCEAEPEGRREDGERLSYSRWDSMGSIWQSIKAIAGLMREETGEDSHDIVDGDVIPDYVFHHAPFVHLYSAEQFWPCHLTSHLTHTTPHLNYTAISNNYTVHNLSSLNSYGFFTYLQSDDNVESRPTWLAGTKNIPSDEPADAPSSSPNSTGPALGRSSAPAVLVTIRKPGGILDAFWFYFYSYNLGNKVGLRFGNHVGDWEHTMIRFVHGKPTYVFLSEHNFGGAYAWSALEKHSSDKRRVVTFSASGSHAMYATPGVHPYVLPWGILHDNTDRGPLWDPSQNVWAYTLDLKTRKVKASRRTPDAPLDWFYFRGHWGDRVYPLSDDRQYLFAGQYHYVSGPLGPMYKNLGRTDVCQGRGRCKIRYWLPPPGQVNVWEGETDDDVDDDEDGVHREIGAPDWS